MAYTEELKELIESYHSVLSRSTIKNLKEENKKLKEENITDSLTKANNRTFYDNNLTGIVNDCFENKKNVGFLMIDLNDFKWINDNYKSHTVGDMILNDFVHLIYSVIPSTDYVIRMGGDEILLVLPDADENTGENLENRLQTKVDLYNNKEIKKRLNEGERVDEKKSEDYTYKISFASAYMLSEYSKKLSIGNIYKKVDRKMYLEKERIKNKFLQKDNSKINK